MNSRQEVVRAVALLMAWSLTGTVGFTWIEGWSLLDAWYMTVITLSTVGFTEVYPLGPGGKLFSTFLIVGGLGTALYSLTRIGQLLVEAELLGDLRRRRMQKAVGKLQNHVVICGFGRVGQVVAAGLFEEEKPFCVVEAESALEREFQELGYHYLIGDATDDETLRLSGVDRASVLLALLPSDADNLYTTVSARNLSQALLIVARASDEKAEVKLKSGGANEVVSPYKMAGARILQTTVRPGLIEFMDLVGSRAQLSLAVQEMAVSQDSRLVGSSLVQAKVRSNYQVIVIAIRRADGDLAFNPEPTDEIRSGDHLVAMGTSGDLRRMRTDFGLAYTDPRLT